jgi:RimJ/RimL family protein N-acetyltransferase
MSSEVKQLGPEQASALRTLLARQPCRNLHLLAALDERGHWQAPSTLFYGYFSSGELRAAALVQPSSGRVVPAASEAADAMALALGLAGETPLRSCLGDRHAVEALTRNLCPSVPRLVQPHRLFTVSPDYLGPFVTPALRPAKEGDLPRLVELAAAESKEVFARDPLPATADQLRVEVFDRIRAQRTWVLEMEGRLVLKADVAARSRFGAEVQGVFTEPESRSRGYATVALGQLTRQLLSALPRVTLRIADSAHSLLAVARKVGYAIAQVEQLLVLN